VKTNGKGARVFTFQPTRSVPDGVFAIATVKNKETGDPSEFSKARIVE
jgi:hypothetical protein